MVSAVGQATPEIVEETGVEPRSDGTRLFGHELRSLVTAARPTGDVLDMRGRHIGGVTDLSDCEISDVDFEGCVFEGAFLASRTKWRGYGSLMNCRFDGNVDLAEATFELDARFDRSRFQHGLTLSRAKIWGVLCLDGAIVEGPAFLDKLELFANLSLDRTAFRSLVSFEESECLGGLWGDRARVEGKANARGMEVHGRLWLVGANAPGAPFEQIADYGYRWS